MDKILRQRQGHQRKHRNESETEADKILKLHEGQVAQGKRINPQTVKLEEIARAFLVDYQINDRKSIDKAIRSVRHLQKFFGNMKVRDITMDKINLFIQGRREDGVSNAEINRETAALKRMFNLAIRAEKVFSKPYIPKLTEDNVRTGFFENPAFRAVLKELPEPIKPVALFGYYTSWRREEIVKLT